jgi:prepilin-type N-terminal cleavage/methylation domain-containing protein
MPARPKHPDCTKHTLSWACPTSRYNGRSQQILRARPALTLIELLLTLAVLGILAAVLIPQLSGDLPERLSAAAQVISADLDYARSVAVANNTRYQITFDVSNNEYKLRHSGTNPIFNTLPRSPFGQTEDAVNVQTTDLSKLPIPEPRVRIVAVVQMQGAGLATSTLEFTPLGGTTSSQVTVIWLACGSGQLRRFCAVSIDPVTGLVSISQPTKALPANITTIVQQAVEEAAAEPSGS